jgi:F-type H+-transporting ATPase subunit b
MQEHATDHSLLASPELWVLVAFVLFIVIVSRPVMRTLTTTLDGRTARIKRDLEEAARLREEASAMLAQYQRKHRDAMSQAQEIVEHARAEAERLAQQSAKELEASLARRESLALQRIAQAEGQATAEVRAAAVDIAIAATQTLLTQKVDGAKADALIEQAIRQLPAKLH